MLLVGSVVPSFLSYTYQRITNRGAFGVSTCWIFPSTTYYLAYSFSSKCDDTSPFDCSFSPWCTREVAAGPSSNVLRVARLILLTSSCSVYWRRSRNILAVNTRSSRSLALMASVVLFHIFVYISSSTYFFFCDEYRELDFFESAFSA